MNWKQFLKPSLIKILLALVIFLYLTLEVFIENFFDLCGEVTSGCIHKTTFGINLDMTTIILVSSILSYVISSLIIWIYDKFRKKK